MGWRPRSCSSCNKSSAWCGFWPFSHAFFYWHRMTTSQEGRVTLTYGYARGPWALVRSAGDTRVNPHMKNSPLSLDRPPVAGRLLPARLINYRGCIAEKHWSGTPRPVAAAASVGGHCACPPILHVRRYMTSKGQRAVRGRHARARPPDQAQAARDRRSPGSRAPPATLRRHLRPPAPYTSARHPPPGAQPEPARGTGQRYCVTRILASAALYGSRIYGAKRLAASCRAPLPGHAIA